MPKKPARNAFYFYMQNFKEEQRKNGINYKNLAEVAEAAGPLWRDAPPSVRSKFEEMAKREKQKHNGPETKYTSTGVAFSVIDEMHKESRDMEAAELKAIQNFVKLNSFNSNDGLLRADFFIMDLNFYCRTGLDYLVAESSLLRFSLIDGIKEPYHEIINPGRIPIGYACDVKNGCEALGLEMPDDLSKRSNYMQILAYTIDYLKQGDRNATTLPPIFTMDDRIIPVVNYIQQLCGMAAEDETLFRVYKLDTLFYTIMNTVKTTNFEGFPKTSLAHMQLSKDGFAFSPGLACEFHEEIDKATVCSLARVRRWAFTLLDSCCPVAGVDMLPGKHLPQDYDMEGIHTYKEQRRVRAAPSVAGTGAPMSCNSSISDALEVSLSTSSDSKKKKNVQPSLRMPKIDYSAALRPAPELTDSDLLSSQLGNVAISSGLGRGRGRGNMPGTSKQFD